MFNRYRDIEICKSDIEDFIGLVKEDTDYFDEEKLRALAKGMILFKRVFNYEDQNLEHYYRCLISDMMTTLHSLGKKSQRLFYASYRSMIENLVRVCLKYENLNETGIRNMFSELHSKYDLNGKEYIDYLEGEYGKCCDVVHSNERADLHLYSYYKEIISTDELNAENIADCIMVLNTFYSKSKKFIINCKAVEMDEMFYNHKELLAYLIGKKNYSKFEQNIK